MIVIKRRLTVLRMLSPLKTQEGNADGEKNEPEPGSAFWLFGNVDVGGHGEQEEKKMGTRVAGRAGVDL